jgi:hypothetical protein
MRRRAQKILSLLFMLQFLLWTQSGAAHLVCQCDHSPEKKSCHVPQTTTESDACCADESKADPVPLEFHETMASSTEDENHSCCSQQNTGEQDNKNINQTASFHWCKTVCLNIEMVQAEHTVLSKTNHKTVDLASVSQPLFISNLAIVPIPVEKNFLIYSNSPPLFLLNSAFLI